MGRGNFDGEVAQRWCILRTGGARTLSLARSLANVGLEVWTPSETKIVRLPRGKKLMAGMGEKSFPIMPTFVFARAGHLPELSRILALPVSPHPGFSVFRYLGRIPLLADREIEGLRIAERRVIPKSKQRTFPRGSTVRVPEGSFAGMSGEVKLSDGRFTLVCFGRMEVKIATFILESDDVTIADTPHRMRQRA